MANASLKVFFLSLLLLVATVGLASSLKHDVAQYDNVDLIEENYYCCKNTGRVIYHQLLFYRWCDESHRHQVLAQRFVRPEKNMRVHRVFGRPWKYEILWLDGDPDYGHTCLRIVKSHQFETTWTTFDKDLAEVEHLPLERRQGLSGPKCFQAMTDCEEMAKCR